MTSEVYLDSRGLFSGGRRPLPPPQRMQPIEGQTAKETRHMATVNVKLSVPCATCGHEPVCNRLGAIARLEEAFSVEHGSLPKGLGVVLTASIDCDEYLKVRKSPTTATQGAPQAGGEADAPKVGAHVWTDEQRAAAADRMRQRNAAAGGNLHQAARELEAAESVG